MFNYLLSVYYYLCFALSFQAVLPDDMVLRERDSSYNPYLLCNSGSKWHMSYDVNRLPWLGRIPLQDNCRPRNAPRSRITTMLMFQCDNCMTPKLSSILGPLSIDAKKLMWTPFKLAYIYNYYFTTQNINITTPPFGVTFLPDLIRMRLIG